MDDKDFIPQQGYYRKLRVYQLAEIIYDVTFLFVQKYILSGGDGRVVIRGDRTGDQMVQAARSGKQNIAEGSCAGVTSKETEIKLTNVAKASLQELLLDYEDYIRTREFEIWEKGDKRIDSTRNFCNKQKDSKLICLKLKERSCETHANIAITLIHQADKLLHGLIERQKKDFLEKGGIREQMSKARREYRDRSSGRTESS